MKSRLVAIIIMLAGISVYSKDIYVDASCGDDSWSGINQQCIEPDGPKATIQAAIDSANANDIVIVSSGIYQENINFSGKSITVTGSDIFDKETVGKTVIQGTGTESVVKFVNGEINCSLAGLTIAGGVGSGDDGGGIKCSGSSPAISNCIIRNNSAEKGGGINAAGGNVQVFNSYFYDNVATGPGAGIYIEGSSVAIVGNCVLYNNYGNWGGAIAVIGSGTDVINCTIANNASEVSGGAIIAAQGSSIRAINTIFYHNRSKSASEIQLLTGASASIITSVISQGFNEVNATVGCTIDWHSPIPYAGYLDFPNQNKGDFRLISQSIAADEGTNVEGLIPVTDIDGNARVTDGDYDEVSQIDVGAYEYQPDMSYITVSPMYNYNDLLPFAINAVTGQQETSNISLYINKRDPRQVNWLIESDCSWLSVSESSGSFQDYSFDVELIADVSGLTAGVYETELVVKVDSVVNDYLMVPVSLFVSDDPTIKHVPAEIGSIQKAIDLSRDGDTVLVAPGIYYENINYRDKNVTLTSTNPDDFSIVNSTIIDGSYGYTSVVLFEYSQLDGGILTGFTVQNGKGNNLYSDMYFGCGIYCGSSSPTISKNVIIDNTFPSYEYNVYGIGGGLYCGTSGAVIENNYIQNNTAFEGGGIYIGSNSLVRNNVVSGNNGYWAGGISVIQSGIVTGNTIDSNSSDWEGGNVEIYEYESSTAMMEVTNNIISNAGSGGGVYWNTNNPVIKYFRHNNVWNNIPIDYDGIQDMTGKDGNVSVDPMFVNVSTGDYHLMTDSLCISAGDPSYIISAGEVDIDGDPRVYALRPDIGADEYIGYVRPIAVAGTDQYHDAVVDITLDGSNSYFDDPNRKTFDWSQISGPTVVITGEDSAIASFTPDVTGEYWFSLSVYDGLNWSVPDTVMIVVGNRQPVAVVDGNIVCQLGSEVVLDGSKSYDPDLEDDLVWYWDQVAGPEVNLDGSTGNIARFTCVEKECYTFELTVFDGIDISEPVQIQVMAVEVDLVARDVNVGFATTDYFHYPDFAEKRVAYGVGDACDFTWDIRCKDMETGVVMAFRGEGGSADTQPKLDGNIMVWFATGIGWGDPWQHEPSNASIFVYDFDASKQYALRKYTWTESYSHPAISGRKVVWLEHLGIDPRPSGSSEAQNWYNTSYNICGADISDLEAPVYFTIANNVGNRDPYPCYTYSSDFDDVIDVYGNLVVWEAQGDIYGADISDINNIVVFPICTDTGGQYDPCVYGTMVFWHDMRNDNGDIYGADVSDINSITVKPLVQKSGTQHQPAIDGNILGCVDDGNVSLYCFIDGYSPMPIDIGDPQVSTGLQIGPAKSIGNHVVVWQTENYGQAKGLFVKCSYTVPDGPVTNITKSKIYDTIQNAIYAADNDDVLEVEPGTYNESLLLKGKDITISSQKADNQYLNKSTILNCKGWSPVVKVVSGVNTGANLVGLTITGGNGTGNDTGGGVVIDGGLASISNSIIRDNNSYRGSGIYMSGGSLSISDCIIHSNAADTSGAGILLLGQANLDLRNSLLYGNEAKWGGALTCLDSNLIAQNCTFSYNNASVRGGAIIAGNGSNISISDSIFAYDTSIEGVEIAVIKGSGVSDFDMSYCNILGGQGSLYIAPDCSINLLGGIIDVDPMFADVNIDDYHLKSESGRWDPAINQWVQDLLTSGCIDAGSPGAGIGSELWPHGGLNNLGAYGSSVEASMSIDYQVGNASDITNDGIVNMTDFSKLVIDWQSYGFLMSCDINRDNVIDLEDLNELCINWLSQD